MSTGKLLGIKFKILLKKKQYFYEINLKQKRNDSKELWKTLKLMDVPSRTVSVFKISLKDKNKIIFGATNKFLSF